MILYFADRTMQILGMASTELPEGLTIADDLKSEDVDSGVAIFECTIPYDADNRALVESCTAAGNYLLRSNDGENEFYTIIETEADTKNQTVYIYAEDAGMDLLNEINGAYEATEAHPISYYVEYFANDTGFVIGINEIENLTRTLSWDGEATTAERLASVATQFDNAEISYSYDIKGLEITNKYINIYAQRGKDAGIQLRLNKDIDRIITKKSVADLATSLRPTGGIPEGEEDAITLKGYEYDDGDFYVTSAGRLNSREALKKWSRYVWEKEPNQQVGYTGHIVKQYSYDTTSQSELCNRAISELKEICDVAVNYEVDINTLPDNVKIGDTVYIVDDDGELYLSARILEMTTSVCNQKQTATLGDYLIQDSGISQTVADLAAQFSELAKSRVFYTWIAYADDEEGNGISLDSTGKKYMGIASNRSGSTVDLSDPSVFTWSLIQGEDGSYITSNTITYQSNSSGTEAPEDEDGWSESVVEASQGEYLWTKIETTYSTGETSTSYSVSYIAIDGLDELSVKEIIANEGYITSLEVNDLLADYVTTEILSATFAEVETLMAGYVKTEELEATVAIFGYLTAESATITLLNSEVANITSILSGNIGTGTLQSIHITSDNVVFDEAVINDAAIVSLTANKITSGTIYTDNVQIANNDGKNLWIDGSTIQINDGTYVRVQIGEDASGDYNLYLWGASGSLLWDALGLTEAGLTGNGAIIKDAAIADDANINESKIDMQSVAERLNEDGSISVDFTNVKVNDTTLDYALTTVTNNTNAAQAEAEAASAAAQAAQANATQAATDAATAQAAADTAADTAASAQTTADEATANAVSAKTAAEEAQEAADAAQAAVDAVSIGTKNYLLNTKSLTYTAIQTTFYGFTRSEDSDGFGVLTVTGTDSWLAANFWTAVDASSDAWAGKSLVFSADVNADDLASAPNHYEIDFAIYGSNDGSSWTRVCAKGAAFNSTSWSYNTDDFVDGEWIRLTAKFSGYAASNMSTYSTTEYSQYVYVIQLFSTSANTTGTLSIRKPKLELGTVATDWTPAPEDLQAAADAAQEAADAAQATADAAVADAVAAQEAADTAKENAATAQSTADSAASAAATAQKDADDAQEAADAAQAAADAVAERTTTLETELSVVQGQISSKVWQTDIESAVANTTTWNMVTGTSSEWKSVTVTDITNAASNPLTFTDMNNGSVEEGDYVSVSIDVKFSDDFAASGTDTADMRLQGDGNSGGTWKTITMNGGNCSTSLLEILNSESREGRISTYFKVESWMVDGSYSGKWKVGFRFDYYVGTFYYKCAMANLGETALSWSPAYSEIATQSDVTTIQDQYTTVNQTVSGLVTQVGDIETTVSDNYESLSSQISTIEQTTSGITASVSSVQTQLSNLSVGGRNYLLNTRTLKNKTHTTTVNSAFVSSTDENGYGVWTVTGNGTYVSINMAASIDASDDALAGQELVISADIKCDDIVESPGHYNFTFAIFGYNDGSSSSTRIYYKGSSFNGTAFDYNTEDFVDNEWFRLTAKFTGYAKSAMTRESTAEYDNYVYVTQFYSNSNNSTGTISIRKPKLEIGTVATDWTPAPEDTEDALTEMNESNSETYATKTDVTNEITESVGTTDGISETEDAVQDLLLDENGDALTVYEALIKVASYLTLTSNSFNIEFETITGDLTALTDGTIAGLQSDSAAYSAKLSYVNITDEPAIVLGASDSDFKVKITTTEIDFMEGDSKVAWISNQQLHITEAEISIVNVSSKLSFWDIFAWVNINGALALVKEGYEEVTYDNEGSDDE